MSAAVAERPTTTTKKRGKKPPSQATTSDRDVCLRTAEHAKYFATLFVNIQPNLVLLDQFERHPDNRVPTEAAIANMVESISAIGQLDAIVARKRPGCAKLQILSGETRWLAMRRCGEVQIAARIIECTDEQALALIAEANEKRENLTLIQRAQLLQALMKPVDQGGAGMPRDAAAATFGWAPSTVSNTVKLLEAPIEWQRRLDSPDLDSSGEPVRIHQATVREIAKFASAPRLMLALEKQYQEDLKDEYEDDLRGSRERQLAWLTTCIEQHVRFLEGRNNWLPKHGGWFGVLFDASDPDVRARLDIHDLPLAGKQAPLGGRRNRAPTNDGELTAVATNVELFDQLMLEELDRRNAGKPAKSSSSSVERSPAEQRKLEAERRKKANELLKAWVEDWSQHLLRCSMAETLSGEEAVWVAPWLLTAAKCHYSHGVGEYVTYAAEDIAIRFGGATRPQSASAALLTLRRLARDAHAKKQADSRAESIEVLRRACQLLLWPSSPESRREKLITTGLPDERLPYINRSDLLAWAAAIGVTLEQAWQDGAVDGSPERELIAEFLQRHNGEQLSALCDELCPEVVLPKGKAAAVQAILTEHKPGRPLALPSIAILKDKRKSK